MITKRERERGLGRVEEAKDLSKNVVPRLRVGGYSRERGWKRRECQRGSRVVVVEGAGERIVGLRRGKRERYKHDFHT
jgi:hypothetical protein